LVTDKLGSYGAAMKGCSGVGCAHLSPHSGAAFRSAASPSIC
jgi:hypothetical protein